MMPLPSLWEWTKIRGQVTWRHHYNYHRPHSSIGYLTPMEFQQQLEQAA